MMDIKINNNFNTNYVSQNIENAKNILDASKRVEANFNSQGSSHDSLKMLKEVLDISNTLSKRISFSIDEDTKNIRVKVINSETNEVIREIPSEELQKLHKKMTEALADIGLFIDEKV